MKKCEFHTEELVLIRFVINSKGITMDTRKVQVVVKWPIPKNVHDVRSFHKFVTSLEDL